MPQPSHTPPETTMEKEKALATVAVVAGAIAAIIGAGYLVSWLSGVMAYRSLHIFTIKTNASLCLLLCGSALALAVPPGCGTAKQRAARLMACFAGAIAGATILEHLFDLDLGIDQFLAEEPVGAVGVLSPNRMGMPAALSFTLCGIGILFLLQRQESRVRLVQSLGITLCLIALQGILGHLYHVEGMFAAPRYTAVAWPTSFGVLLLGIGLLFARPCEAVMATFTANTPGALASRRLLVLAIVLPILLGWLRLQGELHGLYGVTFGTSILVLSWIVIFSFLVYRIGTQAQAQQKELVDQQARETLRESEQRLRSIVDNMVEGLIVIDARGAALHWNRKALEMHDYQGEEDELSFLENLADSYEMLTLDGHVVPLEQWPVRRILRGEKLHDLDLQMRAKRRDWQRFYSYSGLLIGDAAGQPQMGVLSIKDITARKEAEDALRKSEELLRTVLETLPVAVWILRADGQVLHANKEAHKLWAGAPLVRIEEFDIFKGWRPDSGQRITTEEWCGIRAINKGETSLNEEVEIESFDGSHKIILDSAVPIVNEKGEITGAITVNQDITDRKRAEEALRRVKDELEQRVRERTGELERAYLELQRETKQRLAAVEDLQEKEQLLVQQTRMAAMGEMLGNIAHQWRQPLNVLGLLVQQLQLTYELGEFSGNLLKGELSRAMKLIRHMSETIDDFKDFLKEEKETQLFSVNNAIATTVSLLDVTLKSIDVSLEIHQRDELSVTGHRNEFCHVVLNLINNATDAFRERKIQSPKVVINIFKENGKSVVTIADNAGGIPEEIMGKIFDPYFTTKGPEKGTGIGLFMSKNIIEKSMGGRLSVRNTYEGAEFRIEF